jgi:xylulokinase
VTQGAAYDAALLAGVGAGVYADIAQACETAIRVTGRTEPGSAAAAYDDYYPRYRALYPALQPEFQAIAQVVNEHLKRTADNT